MSQYFKRFNFNPWKQRIGDCAIRSTSIALNMSYVAVCNAFHVKWKNGYGLVRDTGIDLDQIKNTFGDYFGNVTDFSEELPMELQTKDDEMTKFDLANGIDSSSSGITVNEFVDMFQNEGRFLVGCLSPKKKEGHIVYVNADKKYFIDTFDCGNFIVDSWMQIEKVVPKEDPRRLKLAKDGSIVP